MSQGILGVLVGLFGIILALVRLYVDKEAKKDEFTEQYKTDMAKFDGALGNPDTLTKLFDDKRIPTQGGIPGADYKAAPEQKL